MTQKHVQISAYAFLLILGVSTAWAEVKKEGPRELLPAPTCCCEKGESCAPQCCIERRLRMICSIDFKDTPLEEVLKCFREWAGVNIVVDETALADAGVSLRRPMSLKLDGIPLKKALEMVLHQVRLVNIVKDDVVILTTEMQARGKLINKIYPVEKLVPPSEPVVIEVESGARIFGWATQTDAGRQLLDEAPEDTLVRLVTQAVEPGSWNSNGGPGTVDYFPPSKSLVVHQTEDVQHQVEDLLLGLNRALTDEESVCAPKPFLSLLPCVPAPYSLLTMAAPLPQLCVPPLAAPFASCPAPPPCPLVGLVEPPSPVPAPVLQETARPRAYVLEVKMMQGQPDGKAITCQAQSMAFCPEPSFHGNLVTMMEADEGCQRGLLHVVKATVLKNERVHLQIIGVHGKAEKTNNGRIALNLDATPLIDRKLKLGKSVKKVLERDQAGKPRKWVELMVKEMQQGPVGPVCPSPVALPTPAPMPPAMWPPPCLANPMQCQAVYPMIPPPAIVACTASQPQNQLDQTWRARAVAEEGKTRLAIQTGCQNCVTLKSLELKISGNEPLKLTAAGKQIHAKNPSLQARADAVSHVGPAGCFVFEGHVKLTYKREGQNAQVTAERVLLNLADGHMEIEPVADALPLGWMNSFLDENH